MARELLWQLMIVPLGAIAIAFVVWLFSTVPWPHFSH
jgi:hypothetical protein